MAQVGGYLGTQGYFEVTGRPTDCDADGDLGKNSTGDSATSDGSGTTGESSSTGATTQDPSGPASGSATSGATTDPEPTTTTAATETGDPTDSGSSTTSGGDPDSSGGALPYPECLEPLLMPTLDGLGPACVEFLVIEYTFQGQPVFVFDSSQCGFFDQFFPVFTEDCALLCNLYGLAGITECNGEEFYDNAVEVDSWPYPG